METKLPDYIVFTIKMQNNWVILKDDITIQRKNLYAWKKDISNMVKSAEQYIMFDVA